MIHHLHTPVAPLDQFITSFTYYKGYRPIHSIDRYLPNGNVEIIIDLTDTPKYIYDNDTLAAIQACKRIWISGMRKEFITIPSGLDAEMFIIEFKKGMALPFLGQPLTAITDRVVDGDLILDKVFSELRERLLAIVSSPDSSYACLFRTAEQLLLKRFSSRLTVNPFVDFAVSRIMISPSTLTIKSIADKTGFSAKHFIRIFTDHVGVNPKLLLRILRFQKAIHDIEKMGNISWSSLASECGYYDQAHFIADFKGFSGLTPGEYLRCRNSEQLNYVPVG